MPLLPNIFADELDKFGNPDSSLFDGGPTDEPTAAVKHAAAFKAFMLGLVTVPPIFPPTHDVAESSMLAVLAGQSLPPPAGILVINGAYTAYVGVILAQLASGGWIVAAPAAPPGPILVPPPPGSGSLSYAGMVLAWLTAIMGAIPPAPPAPWA